MNEEDDCIEVTRVLGAVDSTYSSSSAILSPNSCKSLEHGLLFSVKVDDGKSGDANVVGESAVRNIPSIPVVAVREGDNQKTAAVPADIICEDKKTVQNTTEQRIPQTESLDSVQSANSELQTKNVLTEI